MRAPDGFEPEPEPKVTYKPPANINFKSVFETGPAPDSDAPSVGNKGTSRLVDSGASAKKDTTERVSKTGKSSRVRPLKLPVFTTPPRPHAKANLDQKQPTESATSIFRRIHPDSLAASTSKAPPEPAKHKFRPAPPLIIPPVGKPQPALKPLPPPPLPSPSKKGKEKETAQSNLRTISTTHIALATDLNSEAGSASLLSIFLQGNKPDVGEKEEEKEVRRGIGVSPVKSGGKRRGFIRCLLHMNTFRAVVDHLCRNGLAERASNLLSRSQTSFALWHKETSSLSSRWPTADIHFSILKVLHVHSRSTPAIALCRVTKKPQDQLTEDIYVVLFSSPTPNAAERIEEGRKVYVWHPWYVVEAGISYGLDETVKYAVLCSRYLCM
jgi:hypothetical protein